MKIIKRISTWHASDILIIFGVFAIVYIGTALFGMERDPLTMFLGATFGLTFSKAITPLEDESA